MNIFQLNASSRKVSKLNLLSPAANRLAFKFKMFLSEMLPSENFLSKMLLSKIFLSEMLLYGMFPNFGAQNKRLTLAKILETWNVQHSMLPVEYKCSSAKVRKYLNPNA